MQFAAGYHGDMSDDKITTPDQHPEPPATEQDETLTEKDVYEELEAVIDPELEPVFASLGLVSGVNIEQASDVYGTYPHTTPACPIGPQVSEQMKEFVG